MRGWLRRRVHVSWHVAALSWGILAGTALALTLPEGLFYGLAWSVTAASLTVIALVKRSLGYIILILVAGCLFGLWRGSQELHQLAKYRPLYGHILTVKGSVAEDVATNENGTKQIKLSNITIDHAHLNGQVWVETSANASIKRGDTLVLKGKLGKGFGNMAATMYHSQLISAERPQPGDIAREVRDWFADHVRMAIAEPQASLGIGYLTGQRSALPEDLSEQLRLLGLTHIVVASGYNLTILVRLARQLFARASRYLSAISAGAMIGAFVLVTGFSPSMSRAGLVAGLSLLAWYYGRVIHPFVLLPFAAATTVIINPSFMWGDIGWYLSFAAFAGVIILAPLLQHYFWGEGEGGVLRRIFIETASAQLATMPIIACIFGQFAPLALPANLLILPLIPLAMLLTFIAGVGTIIIPSLANVFGWPASIILQYMTTVADWLARLPFAQAEVTFNAWMLIASYAALAGGALYMWRKTRHSFARDSIVE